MHTHAHVSSCHRSQQLRGDAQAVLWQALAGPDSDISREVEMRVLEALCR
jgi:hypothetical protein